MPAGRHFAVTWSIPDDFGGMTEAIFRRSRAFHVLRDTPVDVLTFDHRADYPALELRLREQGVLTDGIRLLNIYDWLRVDAMSGGGDLADDTLDPPLEADPSDEMRTREARPIARIRRDSTGAIVQTDHYRDNGTLLLTDRRVDGTGRSGTRRLVLYDEQERPHRAWRGIHALYSSWLDQLIAGDPSFVIVDSKTMARFMMTYRRPHVVTAHVVHGSHRDTDGRLRASRRESLTNAHRFDILAVLSDAQARDIRRDILRVPDVAVIPNSAGGRSRSRRRMPRTRGAGVVVASLTRRKRVSHAIAAVQSANRELAAASTLDIYGDGESRAALERRIAGDAAIRLHGHVRHARDLLDAASFVLLTSHSEGHPLALVEAMAAGCIPIAYDIPYGPSDVIRHGRNGYLVPPGDVDGLVMAIGSLHALPERKVQSMRWRAIRASRAFTDERVVRRWSQAFQHAVTRRWLRERALRSGVLDRLPILRALTAPAIALAARAPFVRRQSGLVRVPPRYPTRP